MFNGKAKHRVTGFDDPKHRLAIIDDHPLVRSGLAELLRRESDFLIVGEAADGASALAMLNEAEPDLTLVDMSLPDMSGVELIERIRLRQHRTKLLVISMQDESLYAQRALGAGAMGCINKAEPIDHIIAAIRHVLAGHYYVSPPLQEMLTAWTADAPSAPSVGLPPTAP